MPKMLLTVLGYLLFTFIYPRVLVGWLGEANPWTSYLYMYGFGGLTFLTGVYITVKMKAMQKGRGWDDYWFKWLIGGFIFVAAMHGTWIILALTMPHKGGA